MIYLGVFFGYAYYIMVYIGNVYTEADGTLRWDLELASDGYSSI